MTNNKKLKRDATYFIAHGKDFDWKATGFGVEASDGRYDFPADTVLDDFPGDPNLYDWPRHIAESKSWDLAPFERAWVAAIQLHGHAWEPGKILASIEEARRVRRALGGK